MRRGRLVAVALAFPLLSPATGLGDEVSPVVTIDKGPRKQSNKVTAKFKFSADEAATFECSLDGKEFKPCLSPYETKRLRARRHTFEVIAIDAAGNRSGVAIYKWKVKKPKQARSSAAERCAGQSLKPGSYPVGVGTAESSASSVAFAPLPCGRDHGKLISL